MRRLWLLDRLARRVRDAGERGLAFLITAGVASCGGSTTTPADAGADARHDGATNEDSGVIVEAPCCPEAPAYDAGDGGGPIVEAPFYDAGRD